MRDLNTLSNGSPSGRALRHVVIPGSGPSGAGAAHQLVEKGHNTVTKGFESHIVED